MTFKTQRRIEFSDTDLEGIVRFSRFSVFMGGAEHSFLRSLGTSVDFKIDGHKAGWPRLAASCDYQSPARFEDVLDIEVLVPLEEAIRRLTAFPAETLKLNRRGRLAPGYFADVVIFDPATIQDHATFAAPHQFATGVVHVLVNGVPVLQDGEHTGATPGRVVRGPGWVGE